MKKAIACLLSLSLLISALSGCAPTGSEQPDVTSDAPAVSEPPAVTTQPQPEATWDYSDHDDPNEGDYVTMLVDLDALGDGEAHWATQTEAGEWKFPFDGMVKKGIAGYDLRCCDAREADFSVVEDWNEISFNTDTVWPDVLPEGFSPEEILENNKNPGLSVRSLHQQGWTGKGVGLAIIDQPLYTGHEEYAENLKTYELIHCDPSPTMHGPAVASIAVGKTVGVAPEADLYYIGNTFGHVSGGTFKIDGSIMADCILRVCEMNQRLPQESRIRVISISRGFQEEDLGFKEVQDAIRQADEQGILVLTVDTESYYQFYLMGMSRSYFDDPDDPASYGTVSWIPTGDWAKPSAVAVPMGSRAYAACTGPQNYEISHEGGISWAVPWLAGFYALCCQAKPEITPAEFSEVIRDTARIVRPSGGGLIRMIDPAAVIAQLTGGAAQP